jgi:chemosensory pili system protein ChpA (sensor histidine kinase/response regulator)
MAILVVEDDSGVRESFVGVLRDEGYDVHAVEDPIEALKWLETNTPSLVLLDLMLPWMDGVDLAKQIRGNKRLASTPIVVVSARPDLDERAQLAGANDWIKKPMSFEELLHAVQNLAVTSAGGIHVLRSDS